MSQAIELHCAFVLRANGSTRKFLSVSFGPFQYVRWFCFGFSQKPESRCPDGRPLFFFSRPRPNVSRLRRPGVIRAQPCISSTALAKFRQNRHFRQHFGVLLAGLIYSLLSFHQQPWRNFAKIAIFAKFANISGPF